MGLDESCQHLLGRCPDPPPACALEAAETSLRRLQALRDQTHSKSGAARESYELTPLGKHLAALPCAPKVGRLLIYGALFSCMQPASAIAAALMSKNPFLSGSEPGERSAVDESRRRFALAGGSTFSDHVALVAAVSQYTALAATKPGQSQLRQYCKSNGISFDRMQELLQTQRELLQAVASLGFFSSDVDALNLNHQVNKNSKNVIHTYIY